MIKCGKIINKCKIDTQWGSCPAASPHVFHPNLTAHCTFWMEPTTQKTTDTVLSCWCYEFKHSESSEQQNLLTQLVLADKGKQYSAIHMPLKNCRGLSTFSLVAIQLPERNKTRHKTPSTHCGSIFIMSLSYYAKKPGAHTWSFEIDGLPTTVSTRAVIGQFSGPYSPARTAKTWSIFVAKLLRDLWPNFLNFYSKQKFKTFFTLNCVLKRASD